MLKNSVLLGSLIGCAIAVPFIYQSNLDLFTKQHDAKPAAQIAYKVQPKKKTDGEVLKNGSTTVIQMDERGHFQADFKLNGRKINALIDTGATYVALNKSMASRLGIKVATADMNIKVSTANGQASAAPVVINEVAIGKIRVKNVEALVLEDKALNGMLMGMSFLKQLDSFAFENQQLILKQ